MVDKAEIYSANAAKTELAELFGLSARSIHLVKTSSLCELGWQETSYPVSLALSDGILHLPIAEDGSLQTSELNGHSALPVSAININAADTMTGVRLRPHEIADLISLLPDLPVAICVTAIARIGPFPQEFAKLANMLILAGSGFGLAEDSLVLSSADPPKHKDISISAELVETLRARAAERENVQELKETRDRFENSMVEKIPRSEILFANADRLPHISCISFEGINGELLTAELAKAGILARTPAACSPVGRNGAGFLEAANIPYARVRGSASFTFTGNIADHTAKLATELPEIVRRLRLLSGS